MQITREADYAIRCILHLAESPGEVVMVGGIAKAKSIPKSFLAKILQKLARANIVKSLIGVNGGFQLAKKSEKINLLDVILAIEGPVAMNKCAIDKKNCSLHNACPVHPVWLEIKEEVERRLKSYNFAKLATSLTK